jgi:hypothetical protein
LNKYKHIEKGKNDSSHDPYHLLSDAKYLMLIILPELLSKDVLIKKELTHVNA